MKGTVCYQVLILMYVLKKTKQKFMFHPSYIILRIQNQRANIVDLDEVAHYEPPHQDLRCLQMKLFFHTIPNIS